MSTIPVTSAGKQKLKDDLAELEAMVPQLQADIAEAREKGDLKENAEYHAAREKLGFTKASIADLQHRLSRSVVVDESMIDTSTVAFGATVDLEDLDDGTIEEWHLVGEGEDDVMENKILTTSPMGQALIGNSVGDEITVEAPMGELRYKIKDIRY